MEQFVFLKYTMAKQKPCWVIKEVSLITGLFVQIEKINERGRKLFLVCLQLISILKIKKWLALIKEVFSHSFGKQSFPPSMFFVEDCLDNLGAWKIVSIPKAIGQ